MRAVAAAEYKLEALSDPAKTRVIRVLRPAVTPVPQPGFTATRCSGNTASGRDRAGPSRQRLHPRPRERVQGRVAGGQAVGREAHGLLRAQSCANWHRMMRSESSNCHGRNDDECAEAFECCDGQATSASEVVAVRVCRALEQAEHAQAAQLSRQFAARHVGQDVGKIASGRSRPDPWQPLALIVPIVRSAASAVRPLHWTKDSNACHCSRWLPKGRIGERLAQRHVAIAR
jgi:hypothetical protein